MLVCRPVGRGNWHTIFVVLPGPPDLFKTWRKERFTIDGITYRVSSIQP